MSMIDIMSNQSTERCIGLQLRCRYHAEADSGWGWRGALEKDMPWTMNSGKGKVLGTDMDMLNGLNELEQVILGTLYIGISMWYFK